MFSAFLFQIENLFGEYRVRHDEMGAYMRSVFFFLQKYNKNRII